MPSNKFIGHVSIHHLVPSNAPAASFAEWDHAWVTVCADLGASNAFVVREFGTEEGHAHYHYYLEVSKSKATVHRKLQGAFSRAGTPNPGQHVSCKPANESKLTDYFLYCCKGPHAKPIPAPREKSGWIILDQGGRLVDELHEQFHKTAQEIRDKKKRKLGVTDWYKKLADECIASRNKTKEDVLQVVTRYYVYESGKGFDKFAVTRTFWAVFSLVNGKDAHELLLEQCNAMIAG